MLVLSPEKVLPGEQARILRCLFSIHRKPQLFGFYLYPICHLGLSLNLSSKLRNLLPSEADFLLEEEPLKLKEGLLRLKKRYWEDGWIHPVVSNQSIIK